MTAAEARLHLAADSCGSLGLVSLHSWPWRPRGLLVPVCHTVWRPVTAWRAGTLLGGAGSAVLYGRPALLGHLLWGSPDVLSSSRSSQQSAECEISFVKNGF